MKQIYLLERRDGKASTSALAEAMGVSAASATAMAKKLASLGLVEHSRYHGVTLTPPGEKVALEVVRHHRLLEVYLTQTLGLSWDRVHSEAERLEHVLSEELEAEIDRVLGYPGDRPPRRPDPDPRSRDRGGAGPAHGRARARPGRGRAPGSRRRSVAAALSRRPRARARTRRSRWSRRRRSAGRSPLTSDGTQQAVGVELAGRIGVEVTA